MLPPSNPVSRAIPDSITDRQLLTDKRRKLIAISERRPRLHLVRSMCEPLVLTACVGSSGNGGGFLPPPADKRCIHAEVRCMLGPAISANGFQIE